jgi:NADPH:quinone reductase-like Zn-dependent oxidoreductase
MKAIQFDRFGGPEVLTFVDVPKPSAGPGEVVVDIHAAGVNPADWKGRAGINENAKQMSFPHIPGRDFSGVISAIGAGVGGFRIGDAVFGVVAANTESTYCEAVAIPTGMIARKPANVSHVEMAAISLGALTALIALEDTAKLKSGETILIQGGAGGVGGIAVQIAHHLGAHVIATARGANHAYVQSLGADEMIDYSSSDFTAMGKKCDVVFDTVGGVVQSKSALVLKANGRLVFVARGENGFTPPIGVQMLRPNVVRDRLHMDRVADLVASGVIKPPAIQAMPLEQAGAAQEISKTGHVRGKIVLTVRS